MPEMIQMLDENALLWIQDAVRVPILDPFVEIFTSLGNAGVLWIVLSWECCAGGRPGGRVGPPPAGYGPGDAVYQCDSEAARAPSPPLCDDGGPDPAADLRRPQPSRQGHTCAAFAAGMAWAGALPWRWARAAAVVQAVCMGLSRLYVGVHYPSDVLAGALIGGLCALCALWLAARSRDRRRESDPQFSGQKSRPAAVSKRRRGGSLERSGLRSVQERRPVPPSQAVSWTRPPPRKGERRHPPGPDSGARLKGPFQAPRPMRRGPRPSPSSWEAGWIEKAGLPLLPYQVFPFSQNSMVGISMGLNIGITPCFDGSAAGGGSVPDVRPGLSRGWGPGGPGRSRITAPRTRL